MTAPRLRSLFGTDGIRAVARDPPLDPITIFATGVALAHSLRKSCAEPAVLLGRDTRESSPWIAAELAAGLRSAGARVASAGIVPTPAVAFLWPRSGFQTGVVISASRNPWRDNGIDFRRRPTSCPIPSSLAMEDEILHHAALIASQLARPTRLPFRSLKTIPLSADCVAFLIDCVPDLSLTGLRIVADCANGAPQPSLPRFSTAWAATSALLNVSPDGRNTTTIAALSTPPSRG